MSEVIEANPDRGPIWKRGLFMLMFSVLYGVAEVVLSLLVFVQFVLVLISGSANQQLLRLGGSLARYTREVFEYLTFNTCLLYTSPSPRDQRGSRMPSSA